jgi:two-component system sensor histidine kinase GlrK
MLLAIGFSLVAGPLIVALVNNAVAVDTLADQSQKAVYQAVQATQISRTMADQITAMERAARTYLVVADKTVLETYEVAHQQFKETAHQFGQFPLSPGQRAKLDEIIAKENVLHQQLDVPELREANIDKVSDEFGALFNSAQSLIKLSNELIDREVQALQELATQARKIVGRQLLALLPVVFFIGGGVTILTTRPIRQIEGGIRSIGAGQLDRPIEVNGPQDMENVGRQLNWLRQRLKELEEQKARFLRHVSHELKTPLTALREGSDLLAEEATGKLNDEQKEIARILQDNSIRLRALIEDLLNYSSINHQQESLLQMKPIRIRELIERVSLDHKLLIQSKEIRLNMVCDSVIVEGDEEKMRVIIDNLFSNAVKFTPHGGWIKIRSNKMLDAVEIHFIDSGPGITEDERGRIFDPFFRGSAEGLGPVRGSGLGLSIVKDLLVAHHGSIKLLQDSPNEGGHFLVKIPLKQSQDILHI